MFTNQNRLEFPKWIWYEAAIRIKTLSKIITWDILNDKSLTIWFIMRQNKISSIEWGQVTNQLMQIGFIIHSLLSCEQLQKNNAETIDIWLLIDPWRSCVLRINITDSPKNISWCMGFGRWYAFSRTKIREVSFKILIEKNVRGLHIPVNDAGVTVVVEIS